MKISNKVGPNAQGVEGTKANKLDGKSRSEKAKSSSMADALGGTAKVNLSDRAQSMQKAKDIASDQSIDEAKVARLQKLIDEGKYSVDARAVADRLVDEHMAMDDE